MKDTLQLTRLMMSVILVWMATALTEAARTEVVSGVRLLGQTDDVSFVGYVQVSVSGHWLAVCNHGWNDPDARAVCIQHGYARGVSFPVRELSGTPPTELVWPREIQCTPKDERLDQCRTSKVSTECDAATLSCDRREAGLVDGSLRLAGSRAASSGRVEVAYQGLWGGVCDRHWDEATASTVCRILGISSSGTPVYTSGFGAPFEVFLDPVQCLGGEDNITECTDRGWLGGTCLLERTAGVMCHDETLANRTGQLRLTGGRSPAQGYLEVSFYGVWGMVCGHDWAENNARVACRQLGYTTGRPSDEVFSLDYRPSWLYKVHCHGNESTLVECALPKYQHYHCLYTDHLKVQCTNMDEYVAGPDSVDDPLLAVYIAVGSLALVVIGITIVVVRRRKREIIIANLPSSPHHEVTKLGPKLSDTRNPVYHIDTSVPGQETARGDLHTSVYNEIPDTATYNTIRENQIYLDILDDGPLMTSRANTPLPDLPVTAAESTGAQGGTGFTTGADPPPSAGISSSEPSHVYTDGGYLQPISERRLQHKYANIRDVTSVDHVTAKDKNDHVIKQDEDFYVTPDMQHAHI